MGSEVILTIMRILQRPLYSLRRQPWSTKGCEQPLAPAGPFLVLPFLEVDVPLVRARFHRCCQGNCRMVGDGQRRFTELGCRSHRVPSRFLRFTGGTRRQACK